MLGRGNLGALSGAGLTNIAMRRPEQMKRKRTTIGTNKSETTNRALSHVLKVEHDLESALRSFSENRQPPPQWHTPFSNNPFSRQLENAANVIAGEAKVPVIKVSHSGFDTHNNQRGLHDRLLAELAAGLAQFRSAMKQIGRWDQVLVMTYSEFGRRVAENGSRGDRPRHRRTSFPDWWPSPGRSLRRTTRARTTERGRSRAQLRLSPSICDGGTLLVESARRPGAGRLSTARVHQLKALAGCHP